jgi:hypothetical protein
MKKKGPFFIAFVFTLMIITPGYAEWVKYDDFRSTSINLDKWEVDSSSAIISIENGMVKFEHQPGHPNDSSFLIPKINTEKIEGIKVTVIFDSCDFLPGATAKDVRARVACFIGTDKTNPYIVFSALSVEPYYRNGASPRLHATVERDALSNYSWIDTPFWGQFLQENGMLPEDVMKVPYTVKMEWDREHIKYTVEGQGAIYYDWERLFKVERIKDPEQAFVGIGTRSNSGAGPCTVYFDNVYVKY